MWAYASTLLRVYAVDGVAVLPSHVAVTFAELLRQRRSEHGMTQAELARLLGVQQQAVNRWENDKDVPRRETVRVIARVLGISGSEIAAALGYVDEQATPQEGLRLPRGVKLEDLDPQDQKALERIVDAFIESVRREAR